MRKKKEHILQQENTFCSKRPCSATGHQRLHEQVRRTFAPAARYSQQSNPLFPLPPPAPTHPHPPHTHTWCIYLQSGHSDDAFDIAYSYIHIYHTHMYPSHILIYSYHTHIYIYHTYHILIYIICIYHTDM